jgi:hypothetical protein
MRFIYTLSNNAELYDVDTCTTYRLSRHPGGVVLESCDFVSCTARYNNAAEVMWRSLAMVVQDVDGRNSSVYGRMLNDMQLFKDGKTANDRLREAVLAAAEALDICAEISVDAVKITHNIPVRKVENNTTRLEEIAAYLRDLMEDPNA